MIAVASLAVTVSGVSTVSEAVRLDAHAVATRARRRRTRTRRPRRPASFRRRPCSDEQRDGGAGDRRAALGGQDATFEAAGAGRRRGRRRERCRVRARGGVGRGRGGDGRGIEGVAIADARRDRLVALARGFEGELLDGLQRRGVQLVAGGADHLGVGQRAVGGDRQLEIDGGAFGRRRVRALRLDELRHARRRHRRRGRGGFGCLRRTRAAPRLRSSATPARSQPASISSIVYRASRPPRGRISQSRASAHHRETVVIRRANAAREGSARTTVRADTRQLSVAGAKKRSRRADLAARPVQRQLSHDNNDDAGDRTARAKRAG